MKPIDEIEKSVERTKNIDDFLKLPSIKHWAIKLKFNGIEFEGDINHYSLGFINGAWFIFNEDHKK